MIHARDPCDGNGQDCRAGHAKEKASWLLQKPIDLRRSGSCKYLGCIGLGLDHGRFLGGVAHHACSLTLRSGHGHWHIGRALTTARQRPAARRLTSFRIEVEGARLMCRHSLLLLVTGQVYGVVHNLLHVMRLCFCWRSLPQQPLQLKRHRCGHFATRRELRKVIHAHPKHNLMVRPNVHNVTVAKLVAAKALRQ